jgi:signal transduction histidine kinase
MAESSRNTSQARRSNKARRAASARSNQNPIYTVLVVGYVILLFLIWLTGTIGVRTISDISIQAGEQSNDYNRRLTLALNIRYAAANAIVEARLLRGCDTRVPVPPFRRKLSEARNILQKRIDDGRDLWGKTDSQSTISPDEIAAWKRVEVAVENFWGALASVDKKPETETAKALITADVAPLAAPTIPPVPPESQPVPVSPESDAFLGARSQLEEAADNLAKAVISVRDNLLNRYTVQQMDASNSVSWTQWIALSLGLGIAAVTFWLVQRQIREIRRATTEEQDAKDFARSVFDSQLNYIIVVGRQGELLSVNQAFMNSLGMQSSALVLQDYHAAFSHMPDIAAFVGKTLKSPDEMMVHRERIEVKGREERSAGPSQNELRVFDVSLYPLLLGGRPRGRVIVLVDVTTAEKQREELRKSRTLSTLGQVTAQVAHELYNPIGAVKLNIELLEMQLGGNDDVKHTLARLKRGAEHLSTIAQDLRYLTKPRDPERKPTDLNKLLDEVVELVSDRLERTRIRVIRNYSRELLEGEYDSQQLRKVFLNLLINAVEASPQSGEVELRTSLIANGRSISTAGLNRSRGVLSISVIDHGVGMSPETKRRLFEAFYTTKRNGTGLGMMITQEIIKKHGGKIEVDSEEGRGTTVNVYLPV